MRYRRLKRSTVQLTSLLDLLFVMIFVSLIQQKQLPETIAKTKHTEVLNKPKAKIIKRKSPSLAKTYQVSASFSFYSTASNPQLPSGTFLMQGTFDEKKLRLQLGGVSWIQRPKNYDMVPLSGTINPKIGIFNGQVDFPGCQKFSLKREEKVSGSPIAGTWKGIYRCGQGETGLTLKID